MSGPEKPNMLSVKTIMQKLDGSERKLKFLLKNKDRIRPEYFIVIEDYQRDILREKTAGMATYGMNVLGITITRAQLQKALDRMKKKPFFASDITSVLIKAGVPETAHARFGCDLIASKTANRLIQQHRKSLFLSSRSPQPTWKWITQIP